MDVKPIDVQSMMERMSQGESYVLLDIRRKNTFQNWQIKGMSLQAVNVPYFDFKELEVNDKLIPQHSRVVLLSQYNDAAAKVAKRLLDKGYRVSYLEGGAFEWDDFYLPCTIMTDSKMKLMQINRLASGCLSYCIVTANRVIVVDPSRHIEQYLAIADREHAKITHVIDTHVHTDHVSGALELLRRTGAEYFMAYGEFHQHDIPVQLLRRGTMHVGSLDIRVIVLDTEGETRGNTLLALGSECLLSGDAIAVGEVGIPDLPGSAQEWADKQFNTVLREIKSMSDDMIVLPAHYGDIQAVNAGGYVGAVLGDLRLGAEAMARVKALTFANRPKDFVAALHPISEDIKEVNLGLQGADAARAEFLERDARA